MAARGKSASLDVTKGVIWRQLATLFLPVLAGAVFQELYTLSNTFIVGQYASKTALGAIQATATLTDLVVSITMGMGMGCSVIVSQHFGARDGRRLQQAVHTALALSIVLGLLSSVAGVLCAGPLLRAMDTPSELLDEALSFSYIYFGAAALAMIFNMGAAVQRAVGDTRTPSRIIALTCLANIALDILLVVRFGLGARGAALATAGSYLLGTALTLWSLTHVKGPWRVRINRIRISAPMARDMLACALPLAAQNAIFPLSNMVVQSQVNSFGSQMVIAWGLSARIGSVVWLVSDALAMATTTFAAQNFGATNYARMKRGLHVSLVMSVVFVGAVEAVICVFAPQVSALFVNDRIIANLTATIVVLTVPFYLIFSWMDNIAGVIRGSGESFWPMVIIVLGTCVLRIAWMLSIVPRYHSILAVIVSYPATWIFTTLLFVVYYRHGRWITRSLRRARHLRADA